MKPRQRYAEPLMELKGAFSSRAVHLQELHPLLAIESMTVHNVTDLVLHPST